MRQWLANIEEEWPAFKYLGFGCYYAWIFLCYSSNVLFSTSSSIDGVSAQTVMYLLSTSALAVTLLLSAIAHKQMVKLVANMKFVVAAAAIATVATAFIAGTPQTAGNPLFWAGCVLSGMGTAFISLRYGMMYSVMGARKAMTNAAASFVLAGALYFVVVGVPHGLSLVLCVGLPFLAALCTVTFDAKRTGRPGRAILPAAQLPRHFFLKLVVAIAAFSAIAGFYNAMGANVDMVGTVTSGDGHAAMVFIVAVVALLLLAVGGSVDRDFDLSKLYYPIIVIACFGIIVVPLIGGYSPVQRVVIAGTYNLFILFVWCLLAHVANRTDMASVMVFGFGRGASAVGTTVGWLSSTLAVPNLAESPDTLTAFAVVMVFILVVVSLVVLKEGTIDQVLSQTGGMVMEADGEATVPGVSPRRAEKHAAVGASRAAGDGAAADVGAPEPAVAGAFASTAVAAGAAAVSGAGSHAVFGAEASASTGVAGVPAASAVAGNGAPSATDSHVANCSVGADAGTCAAAAVMEEAVAAAEGEVQLRRGCAQVAQEFGLSEREAEVLVLLAQGNTIDQISQELCVSFNTSKSHVRHVYTKTGVHTRKELLDLTRGE